MYVIGKRVSNPQPDERTRINPSSQHNQASGLPGPGVFAPGEIIGGNFRVLSEIGRGGMGMVYRVHHLFLDKELALKTLTGDKISETTWKRFQIEGQAIGRLDHPNIIRIYDLGVTADNQPYYVMDLVQGYTLAQLIERQGAIAPAMALPIFRQVSAGLAYAHGRGIIHRDLKPSNIMLLPGQTQASAADATGQLTVKILDFGLAKLTDAASGAASGLTRPGEIFGSPLYMSPEQSRGESMDERTDMYSFGCSMFEALTGELPLKGGNALETMMMHQSKMPPRLAEARPDLTFSPEVERLVGRLLAKSPGQRYRSFADISQELLRIERGGGTGGTAALNPGTMPVAPAGQARTGEFTDPPPESILTARWFWPVAVSSLLVLLILLGLGSYSFFAHELERRQSISDLTTITTKPEAPAQAQATAPEPEQSDEGHRPYFSKIIDSPAGKQRQFTFPQEPIGYINYMMPDALQWQLAIKWKAANPQGKYNPYLNGQLASGKLTFSINDMLDFHAMQSAIKTPGIFKQFRPDDLNKVDLSGLDDVTSDLLLYIRHLSSLRELAINNTEVDNKALKIIDKLPHLTALSIDGTKITGDALVESATFKRVRRLSFAYDTNASAVINAASKSTNIAELRLDGSQLTTADLRTLAGMPRLEKLCLNNCNLGDSDVKIIANSKSVTRLDLENRQLTPASIETLAKMNLVRLTLKSDKWNDVDAAKLQDMLRRKNSRKAEVELKKNDLLGP